MLIEAFRVTHVPFSIHVRHLQAPNLKWKREGRKKKSFHVVYLLLKLAQLLRLQSFVIIGQTWRRGAPCVAHTVLFFIVSCYKKCLLVEALSQIATARTTATLTTTILIIARVKTQENTNELFKYVNYCISQDFVERKKKLGNEKNKEKKG